MAVIDIRAESSSRTRMIFDFRAVAPGCDDVARIEDAIVQSRGDTYRASDEATMPPAQHLSAADRDTSPTAALPTRGRVSA